MMRQMVIKRVSIRIKEVIVMLFVFIVLTSFSTLFFKGQLEPFAVHSDLSELEKEKIGFISILSRNTIVCAIAISGVFLLGIPSILVFVVNPIVVGFVLAANWVSTGELFYFVRILIPHSLFEVPAIVISCSIGLNCRKGRNVFKEGMMWGNAMVILILLIVAAFIESTVSVSLIK